MKTSSDPLDRLLGAWRLTPSRDPQFRAGVWARLQSVRDTRWVVYVRQHAAASAAALVLTIAAGGWLGQWQAQAQIARDRETLTVTYLAEVDARVKTNPPQHH